MSDEYHCIFNWNNCYVHILSKDVDDGGFGGERVYGLAVRGRTESSM